MDQIKPDMRLKENRSQATLKKGNATWSPANVVEISNKEDGYRYRWVDKKPAKIARKKAEQWEIVSGIDGQGTTAQAGSGRINDGKSLTSVREGTDCVLMRIPEETAQARDRYIDGENERRIAGLTSHIKKEVGKSGANTHGSITVSSRKGEQVYD